MDPSFRGEREEREGGRERLPRLELLGVHSIAVGLPACVVQNMTSETEINMAPSDETRTGDTVQPIVTYFPGMIHNYELALSAPSPSAYCTHASESYLGHNMAYIQKSVPIRTPIAKSQLVITNFSGKGVHTRLK